MDEESFGPLMFPFSSFLLITFLYARDNKPPTIIVAIVLVCETSEESFPRLEVEFRR